ncbi:type IV pilin protein [Kineococcus terrestris]|uniref:type IV pilin protein n=1 Tax=Kineococcus terrestris TaxID=2044856 RepID=UPI0034DAEC18
MRRRPGPGGDAGFTLVELLVVMIIIGILAAIAVPVFLNQRTKAHDAGLQSDLRTIALSEETYYTDHETYLAVSATATPTIIDSIALTPGAVAGVELNSTGQAFCVRITSDRASRPRVHVSSRGGLQPVGVSTCPAPATY